jgi:hypothetical protein
VISEVAQLVVVGSVVVPVRALRKVVGKVVLIVRRRHGGLPRRLKVRRVARGFQESTLPKV